MTWDREASKLSKERIEDAIFEKQYEKMLKYENVEICEAAKVVIA